MMTCPNCSAQVDADDLKILPDDTSGCVHCTTKCERCGNTVNSEDGGYLADRGAWWCDTCVHNAG